VSQIVSIDVESGAAKTYTSGPGLKVAPQFIGDSVAYWNKLGPDKGLVLSSGATVPGKMKAPSWSADGKMVVYYKEVSSVKPKMTPAYSIDPEFHLDLTSYFASWSPKGDEFVLAEKPGLVIVSARSESPTFSYPTTVLYDSKHVGPLSWVGAPAWSPDGSMIAFAEGAGANFGSHTNPARIAVIHPDGTGFRYLTSDKENAGYPSWSPDSRQIVYRVVGSEQGLRIVNLDDGRVTVLTDQDDDFPGWSPRGNVIAFTSFRSGGFEIYTIHPDGTDVIRLTHDEGNDAHGSWSPDGEWYIFSSSRAGWKDEAMLCGGGDQPYAGLYAMHGDGTGVRQLTDDQWEDALPAVQPITPVK
jgi:Tol biopolymer transport system component